jgi:hypothetical protein
VDQEGCSGVVRRSGDAGKTSNVMPVRRWVKNTDLDTQAVPARAGWNGYEVSSRRRT